MPFFAIRAFLPFSLVTNVGVIRSERDPFDIRPGMAGSQSPQFGNPVKSSCNNSCAQGQGRAAHVRAMFTQHGFSKTFRLMGPPPRSSSAHPLLLSILGPSCVSGTKKGQISAHGAALGRNNNKEISDNQSGKTGVTTW